MKHKRGFTFVVLLVVGREGPATKSSKPKVSLSQKNLDMALSREKVRNTNSVIITSL